MGKILIRVLVFMVLALIAREALAEPVTSFADLPDYVRIEPRPIGQSGDYVHEYSGLELLAEAGGFERTRLMQFDEAASDVSGVYATRLAEGPVLINIYIYPIASPDMACESEMDPVKANITNRFPDATLVEDGSMAVPGLGTGLVARYNVVGDVLGSTMPTRTEAYLFCNVRGPWLVKYRVSYPQSVDLKAAIDQFIFANPIVP